MVSSPILTFPKSPHTAKDIKMPTKPEGRPTTYRTQFCKPARALCTRGATDADLAEYFGVSTTTIWDWKKKHREFANATRAGKQMADSDIERALFERAKGYSHPDTDIRALDGQIVQTPITKHYPPETNACVFWLKNRKPKEWREHQDISLSNPDGSNLMDQLAVAIAQKIAREK